MILLLTTRMTGIDKLILSNIQYKSVFSLCSVKLNRLFFSNYKSSELLVKSVVNIIETSNCLETLSLGCREELIKNLSLILEPLRLHHSKHLTHLSLASVKDDPDYYDFFELDNSIFNSFIRLSILTLDYEYVSDTLLEALDNGCMQRLVIHIHGWKEDYPGTTNMAWQIFVQKK